MKKPKPKKSARSPRRAPGNSVALAKANKALRAEIAAHRRAGAAMREKASRLDAILSAEPECVKITSRDGTVLEMNAAGLAMIEADSFGQVRGKNIVSLVTPEFRPVLIGLNERIFRGEPGTVEFEITGLKGTKRWLETHAVPLRNQRGEVTAMLGITRDMSARKQAERELARNASLLGATIEAISDGVLVVDREERIVLFNQKFAQMWRLPADLLATREDERAVAFVLDQLKSPDAFSRKIDELYDRPEAESFDLLEFKDGRVFERFSQPHRVGSEVVGRVWSFRDVTGRFHAEQRAAELTEAIRFTQQSVVLADLNHRITYVNQGFVEMYGFLAAEALGRPVEMLRRRETAPPIEEIAARALAGGWQGELTNYRKDGTPFPVFLSVNAFRGPSGEVAGFVSVAKDITDRREADQRLRHSEELNRRILESVPGGIVHVGTDGAILQANTLAQQLLGLGYDKLRSMFVADWRNETFHEDGSPFPVEEYPIIKCLRTGESQPPATIGVRRPDGQLFWMIFSAVPLTDPMTGKLTGAVVTFVDITEHRRAEEALRGAEANFRSLVEQSLVGIYVVQGDRFVYVNPRLEEIMGCSAAELLGQPVLDFIAPEDRGVASENVRMRLRGEIKSVRYNLRMLRPDGRVLHTEVHGTVTTFQGRAAIMGVLVDVTERKLAEEQIQKLNAELERRIAARTRELREINDELESFSYSVSHDMRSPLRAMQGFAQALLEDYAPKLDATARQYAHSISRAALHMDALIGDLFAYSRIGRAEMVLMPVPLDVAVAEARHQNSDAIRAAGMELDTAENLPAVRANHTVLPQVITNLLGNAIKFVPKGVTPRVRIWTEIHGEWVRLWVEDNGIGIASQYQGRLFQVFERLHTADEYPGTGIGLAIVRRAMERMGGRFGLESEPGKGSRFWIELPAAEKEPAQ
ncbi:MAG: PAS domain S-box protein [Verrucomicrobia bacterium]|nr:PAS domain S-box protein [Verrucomicrobiota bacterium]